MKRVTLLFLFIILPTQTLAWKWLDLWQTQDQQGMKLLQTDKPHEAAQTFKDKNWQGVSHYRSGEYAKAYELFRTMQSSDGQYNAGNAATLMGQYKEALQAYDKAILLNPYHADAITNREIVKKLLQSELKRSEKQKQSKSKDTNENKKDQSNADSKQPHSKQNTDKHDGMQKQMQADGERNAANNFNSQLSKKDKAQNQGIHPLDKLNDNEQANNSFAISKRQRTKENTKQILHRLSNESVGLLQRKFLRDYIRRHHTNEYSD